MTTKTATKTVAMTEEQLKAWELFQKSQSSVTVAKLPSSIEIACKLDDYKGTARSRVGVVYSTVITTPVNALVFVVPLAQVGKATQKFLSTIASISWGRLSLPGHPRLGINLFIGDAEADQK